MADEFPAPETGYRLVLIAALIAGATYLPASWAFAPSPGMLAWKGAGVGLLAIWAALAARVAAGWRIAVVLAFGALGDVLIEAAGLTIGALAFLAGHGAAVVLYWRERRRGASMAVPVALAVMVPVIAFSLPADRGAAAGIAVYATGLGVMAAAAWLSRFPRRLVALGAVMFAVSDLLIFARLGPLAGSLVPDLGVWPLYFAGQAMIAVGVVGARREQAA